MKRLARILIIVAAILAVLLIGGVWFLNRWLESPETHAHVERELSKAMKMPLKFQKLTLSLWGGLRAEGISVHDKGTQFLESTSFTARHRILPLLKGSLVFEEITIDSPRIVMVQRPDGSWKMPELPQEPKADQKKDEKPATPKPAETPKPKKKEPQVRLEKLVITNGQADFYDKDHKPFASASGVNVLFKDVRSDHLEGRVVASRLIWHNQVGLADLRAGVSNTKEKGLIIPNFTAKVGGGTITGGFARKKEKPETKYSGKIKIADVDLAQAMIDGGAPPPNLTGILAANIEVRGTGDDTKNMSGKGTISFKNGSCREIEMINDLGSLFQLDEIANFGIPEAAADIVIWGGKLNLKSVAISAPPLALTATGTAKLDGKLNLQANLSAAADYVARHPAIEPQFGPADANGMRSVAFNIDGSLTKPKHNLLERLTGTKDKRLQKAIAIDAALNTLTQGQERKPQPDSTPGAPAETQRQ